MTDLPEPDDGTMVVVIQGDNEAWTVYRRHDAGAEGNSRWFDDWDDDPLGWDVITRGDCTVHLVIPEALSDDHDPALPRVWVDREPLRASGDRDERCDGCSRRTDDRECVGGGMLCRECLEAPAPTREAMEGVPLTDEYWSAEAMSARLARAAESGADRG